jgi:hypothetical protein
MRLAVSRRARSPRRLRLQCLEDRAVPATVVWDGGPTGQGTDWLTPANWVGDVLPGPNDDAVINQITNVSTNITVGASTSVHSVTVNTSRYIRLMGGTYSVGAGTSKFYDLDLQGGSVDFADGATLTDNSPLYGASYIEATGGSSGTYTNPVGRTLNLSGAVITAPFTNQGTVLATNSNQIAGAFTTTSTSVIRLPGLSTQSVLTISQNATNNGLIELAAGSANPTDQLYTGSGILTNAPGGTINVPGPVAGARFFNIYINNQGTFNVGAGAGIAVYDFTNLRDTLSGGTFNLAGPVHVTTGAHRVSTNAANVILDGPTAGIFDAVTNDLLYALGTNAANGSLTTRNGASFTANVPFVNAGQITAETGTTVTASATANYAASVIAYTSQYQSFQWAANQTLGPPNVASYGDNPVAWTSSSANIGSQDLTLGFNVPVFSTGAVIRETLGNGFVTRIDAIDTANIPHTVWTGTDPSQPGSIVDFSPTWAQTSYPVTALKIYVDTNHDMTTYEEIDSVRLVGVGTVNSYNQSGGTTTVNGSLAVASANLTGGALAGTGTVTGPVTTTAQIRPGTSPGRLTVTGNFAFASPNGSLVAEITGTAAGTQYDQLVVNGTVTLGGTLAATVSYPSVVGDAYRLIDNDGTDAVVGTFNGLPEGTVVALSGLPYRISYVGGTGNDVVLTRVPHAGVASVAVNDGAAQRSRVTSVTVTFNTVVTLPAAAAQAFQIARTSATGPTGNVTLSVDLSGSTATQTVARLTFSGALADHGSLIDGTYALTVFGAQVTGPGGLAMDGDNNGTAGGDFLYGTNQSLEKLYRLFGDADGNRVVDVNDLILFRVVYGSNTTDPTWDVDASGVINQTDLVAFRANFGMGI